LPKKCQKSTFLKKQLYVANTLFGAISEMCCQLMQNLPRDNWQYLSSQNWQKKNSNSKPLFSLYFEE